MTSLEEEKLPRRRHSPDSGIGRTTPTYGGILSPHQVVYPSSQTGLLTTLEEPEAGTPVTDRIKCVLVGDGSVGKTSLIVSYTTNGYPTEYVPTAFDNYSVVVTVDNSPVQLQLCDTAGQDDFDSLRPLCYPGTDVFLLCFSVVAPTSYQNVTQKWLPEIRKHNSTAPVILCGTQCDLRDDVKVLIELSRYREKPVTSQEASRTAHQIKALQYMECSALTQRNMKEVFDAAILAAMDRRGMIHRHKSSSRKYLQRSSSVERSEVKGWRRWCCLTSQA